MCRKLSGETEKTWEKPGEARRAMEARQVWPLKQKKIGEREERRRRGEGGQVRVT
jgi:hypothetical protein